MKKAKFTVRVQNLKSGEIFCENEFETREEAIEMMNSYPDKDNFLYRVVEIGSEDAK